MTHQSGGCLCGALRFHVTAPPLWVTVCFCHFCQHATGAQGMVEPIFDASAFALQVGEPRIYTHVSKGSGMDVNLHFCATCSGKTHLTFERWPDRMGVFAGSFDAPGWFDLTPDNSKYIFFDSAMRGTQVPPGFRTYRQHAATADGEPLEPEVLSEALHIR